MNILGKNLKQLRIAHKYNQKELAEMLEVSQTSIAHYEAGTRQPTLETLLSISKLFQISVDNLLENNFQATEKRDIDKEDLIPLLTNLLIEKKEKEFIKVYEEDVYQNFSIKEILTELFKEVLYIIGDQWQKGIITEADEHYATNAIRKILHTINIQEKKSIQSKSAVTFLVSQEFHTIGIEMVNTYLEHIGVNTYYLGSDLPSESILSFINEQKPDYIFISITLESYVNNLVRLVNMINKKFKNIPIYIGGQGAQNKSTLDLMDNVIILHSLDEIDSLI